MNGTQAELHGCHLSTQVTAGQQSTTDQLERQRLQTDGVQTGSPRAQDSLPSHPAALKFTTLACKVTLSGGRLVITSPAPCVASDILEETEAEWDRCGPDGRFNACDAV